MFLPFVCCQVKLVLGYRDSVQLLRDASHVAEALLPVLSLHVCVAFGE